MVILSRSFCNVNKSTDIDYIKEKFEIGVRSMRAFEREIAIHNNYFVENTECILRCVNEIIKGLCKRNSYLEVIKNNWMYRREKYERHIV